VQLISRRPFLTALLLGSLHALLFVLSFPPTALWGYTLAAAIPLALIVWHTSSPWRSALGVAIATIPLWTFEQFWMREVSAAGMPAFALYLSIFSGLYVLIAARIRRRWPRIPAPLLMGITWIGMEFFRGELAFDGYAWYLLAHPLIDAPLVPKAAATLGAYGIGMLVAALAGCVVSLADRRWLSAGAGLFVVSILLAGSTLLAPRTPLAAPARIGVVQTNIPQDNKMSWSFEQRKDDFAEFLAITRQAAEARPDIIVWPETMFPGTSLSPEVVHVQRESGYGYRSSDPEVDGLPLTAFHDSLVDEQAELGIPMLVGSLGVEGFRIVRDDAGPRIETDKEFNSAFLVTEGKVADARYDKMFLTPFGEVMPYISLWPWLERQLLAIGADGMSFGLSAGTTPVVFDIATGDRTLRVATPICFEVTSSWVCRHLVFQDGRRRADILISLTNDGWFNTSDAGRANHLLSARWRCAELATPMVRAANTGISVAIAAGGKLIPQSADGRQTPAALPPRAAGVLTADVPLGTSAPTPFAVWGRWIGIFAPWVVLIGLISTFRKPRQTAA